LDDLVSLDGIPGLRENVINEKLIFSDADSRGAMLIPEALSCRIQTALFGRPWFGIECDS